MVLGICLLPLGGLGLPLCILAAWPLKRVVENHLKAVEDTPLDQGKKPWE
jgi:hypothetical protein